MTSSNPVAGGACTGGGVGPLPGRPGARRASRRTRRASAAGRCRPSCTTRSASTWSRRGREFGTTTGRRRRCGWLDFVPLRYAVEVNSASELVLNKLDILSGAARGEGVCTGYRVGGRLVDELAAGRPASSSAPSRSTRLRGLDRRTCAACRTLADLPAAARRYVAAIEERAGVPISHHQRGARAHPDDRRPARL